jgi:hypothetical protein
MRVSGATFSDIKHVAEDLVVEGDRVAFRTRLKMTHTEEFVGVVSGDIQISVVEMGIKRIAKGKIAEMWGLLDTLGLCSRSARCYHRANRLHANPPQATVRRACWGTVCFYHT